MSGASTNTTNALELSDEEFANLDFDAISSEEETKSENTDDDLNTEDTEEDQQTESSADADAATNEDSDDDDTDEGEAEGSSEASTEAKPESDISSDEEGQKQASEKTVVDPDTEKNEATSKEEDTDQESTTTEDVDYKTEYEEFFKPFKANGRDIQIKSVDDARQLMQMGANYNKKMAGLKPHLKMLKMLENNNLLAEEKLNYLIDLDKKNPDAINKLVKESGLDPLSIDTETPDKYKPNTYTVDDTSVELDGILDDIKDTKSFNETLDVVGNKWDVASKQVISKNPSLIKIINQHMESGIYSQIQQAVDNEKMFGRLEGLSDLEAYKQVGDTINAKGGFSKPEKQPSSSILHKPAVKSKAVDPKLKSRKKAASSTQSAASTKKDAEFNPLALSDEEFEKIAASKYM